MARYSTVAPRYPTVDTSTAPPPVKEALPYYLTPEHREWSRKVIERAHGVCQGQGCGRTEVRLYADHIIELRDMAENDPRRTDVNNGRALCGSCHTTKTAKARAERALRSR